MPDQTTTLETLKQAMAAFVQERDWEQYHSPKNLSMNIAIEAAELMEKFLWLATQESHDEVAKNRIEIEHEFADVMMGLLNLANVCKIDISDAVRTKLELAAKKYPVEKAKGRREKYDRL